MLALLVFISHVGTIGLMDIQVAPGYQPTNPCFSISSVQSGAFASNKDPKAYQAAASTWSACANTLDDTNESKCPYTMDAATDYGMAAVLAEDAKNNALAAQMYLSSYGQYHKALGFCKDSYKKTIDEGMKITEIGIYRTAPNLGVGAERNPKPSASATPRSDSPSPF